MYLLLYFLHVGLLYILYMYYRNYELSLNGILTLNITVSCVCFGVTMVTSSYGAFKTYIYVFASDPLCGPCCVSMPRQPSVMLWKANQTMPWAGCHGNHYLSNQSPIHYLVQGIRIDAVEFFLTLFLETSNRWPCGLGGDNHSSCLHYMLRQTRLRLIYHGMQ